MTVSPVSPAIVLPPNATPAEPGETRTESGIILPPSYSAPGEARTGSGLIVVQNQLSTPAKNELVVVRDANITSADVVSAARDAHASIAKESGKEAADIMMSNNVALASRVHNDLVREAMVQALMGGDVSRAVELIGQLDKSH